MTPDAYMAKAERALASARLLLADGDINGAVNRAYYAMFEAAHAALLTECPTINPAGIRTHTAVISAFGRHLVKTGRLPAEVGKAMNRVEQIRLLADYTGEEVGHERADWAVAQAEVLVNTVRDVMNPGRS